MNSMRGGMPPREGRGMPPPLRGGINWALLATLVFLFKQGWFGVFFPVIFALEKLSRAVN